MLMDLRRVKHLPAVLNMGVDTDDIIICGDATLALYNIKDNETLEILIKQPSLAIIKHEDIFGGRLAENGDVCFTLETDITIYQNQFSILPWNWNRLLKSTTTHKDLKFMSLAAVIEWKQLIGDMESLTLIKDFLLSEPLERSVSL